MVHPTVTNRHCENGGMTRAKHRTTRKLLAAARTWRRAADGGASIDAWSVAIIQYAVGL